MGEVHEGAEGHEVTIASTGERFTARADRPLLQSAHEAGLPLESSCRNGTCRACMRRLRSGNVGYRIEWPGLLAEEKAAGWILPCVAFPRSALVIDQ
jgi:ferredoxin